MRIRNCRTCKKEYVTPSPWPGCCSVECKDKRKNKLEKKASDNKIDPRSNAFLDSREWKELRYKALLRYGRQCMCCGARPPTEIHVDHIKARKTHPHLALSLNNLQILCKMCNQGKGTRSEDFR